MQADSETLEAMKVLLAVPNYILVSGAATKIIASGLRVTEVV